MPGTPRLAIRRECHRRNRPAIRAWFAAALLCAAAALGGCPPAAPPADDATDNTQSDRSAPPAAPTLREQALVNADGGITLNWSSVRDADFFAFYISASGEPEFVLNMANTSYTLAEPVLCATYRWKVESVTSDGRRAASKTAQFTTACPADAPSAPIYPDPPHEAYGVEGPVELRWQPTPKATSYEVYFGQQPHTEKIGTTGEPRFDALPGIEPGAHYYWRVVARNDAGAGESRTWEFSTLDDASAPAAAIYLMPHDGDRNTPPRLWLDWTDTRRTHHYDVHLGTSADPPKVGTTTASEWAVREPLEFGRTYYWRVVARNGDKFTDGPLSSFTVAAAPRVPEAVSDPAPPDGAVVQPESLSVLTWRPSLDADFYDVYLSTGAASESVARVFAARYVLPASLDRDAAYFWHVSAGNAAGITEGPAWRFFTSAAAEGDGGDDGDGGVAGDGGAPCIGGLRIATNSASHVDASISADGGQVAFTTSAALVPGDTNQSWDIYVRDLASGSLTRVSVGSNGSQGAGDSSHPSLSANGRYVAFASRAQLDSSDNNGTSDVYLHDCQSGQTSLVSRGGDGASDAPSLASGGGAIAFHSAARNLVAGDGNAASDIFAYDRASGLIELVSLTEGGGQMGRVFGDCSMSADGRRVAFTATDGASIVFVRDRAAGSTVRTDRPGGMTTISGDGGSYAFVAGNQLYVSPVGGAAVLASVSPSGEPGDRVAWLAGLSHDGRYVAFSSHATNLIPDLVTTDTVIHIYRRDMATNTMELLSQRGGQLANRNSATANNSRIISADGRHVVFTTTATNLASPAAGLKSVVVTNCQP